MIPTDEIYRKRRAGARDYFANVPPSWIDLDHVMYTKQGYLHDPLWQGLNRWCEAVGCVLSWLKTMPEIQEWYWRQGYSRTTPVFESAICRFLGIQDGQVLDHEKLFASRLRPDLTEHAEGMERMERLLTLPIVRREEVG